MELIGMKAICQQVQRSESTVLIWIRDMDFPAKKIGGIWESSTEVIKEWKARIFNGEISTEVKREEKKEKAGTKKAPSKKSRKKPKKAIRNP